MHSRDQSGKTSKRVSLTITLQLATQGLKFNLCGNNNFYNLLKVCVYQHQAKISLTQFMVRILKLRHTRI